MNAANKDNSILEFLLDMLQKKMCDPTSKYYLPTLVTGIKNPQLVPYTATAAWTLPNISGGVSIITCSNQICIQGTPLKDKPAVGIASAGPNIILSNMSTTGLNNVQPEQPTVTDPNSDAPKVSVVLNFCTILNDPKLPKSITITGDLSLSQDCCIPNRVTQKCDAESAKFNTAGTGTFTTTLTPGQSPSYGLSMTCNFTVTVQEGGAYLVTVTDMVMNIPKDTMKTKITIGEGNKKDYEKLADEALASDDAKQKILEAFTDEAKSPNVRAVIGNMMTQQLNGLFNETKGV